MDTIPHNKLMSKHNFPIDRGENHLYSADKLIYVKFRPELESLDREDVFQTLVFFLALRSMNTDY